MWFPLASQIWAGVAGGGQHTLCVIGSLHGSTCHLTQLASSPPPQLLTQISPQLQLPCLFPISWQLQQGLRTHHPARRAAGRQGPGLSQPVLLRYVPGPHCAGEGLPTPSGIGDVAPVLVAPGSLCTVLPPGVELSSGQ
jgi:hypothetical protein